MESTRATNWVGIVLLIILSPILLALLAMMLAFAYALSPLLVAGFTLRAAVGVLRYSTRSLPARLAYAGGLLVGLPPLLFGLFAPVQACLLAWAPKFAHPLCQGPVTLALGLCGVALGTVWLLLLVAILRDRSLLRRMKAAPIGKLAPGLVEFEGEVRLLPESLAPRALELIGSSAERVREPPSDAVVAWTNETHGYGRTAEIVSKRLRRRFLVADDTGSVLVDPGEADIAGKSLAFFWDRRGQFVLTRREFRTSEDPPATGTALCAGDRVHALGWAEALGEPVSGATLAVRGGGPPGSTRRSAVDLIPGFFEYLFRTLASFFRRAAPLPVFLVSDTPEADLSRRLLRAYRITLLPALVWLFIPGWLTWKGWQEGVTQGWDVALDENRQRARDEFRNCEQDIRSPDRDARSRAAGSAVWNAARDVRYRPFLLIALRDPDPEIRRHAWERTLDEAIGWNGQIHAKYTLQSLETAPPDLRSAVERTIAGLGDAPTLSVLLEGMKDPEPRIAVATALEVFAPRIASLPPPQPAVAAERMLALMSARELNSLWSGSMARAMKSIEENRSGSVVPLLVKALDPADPRWPAALFVLRGLGPSARPAASRVMGLLLSPPAGHFQRTWVQQNALKVLVESGADYTDLPAPTAVVPLLLRLLESSSSRYEAATLLGRMGDESRPVLRALTEALRDPEDSVRAAAAGSLGILHALAAARDLLDLFNDPSKKVQDAARDALRRIAPDLAGAPDRAPPRMLDLIRFQPIVSELYSTPAEGAQVTVLRTPDELRSLLSARPRMGVNERDLTRRLKTEVLVLVTAGLRPTPGYRVRVRRVHRSPESGDLTLEIEEEGPWTGAPQQVSTPFALIAIDTRTYTRVAGCRKGSGEPWPAAVTETFTPP